MLHPVVVTKDGVLVAGHRRLEAARILGMSDVPATVVNVTHLLAAERDENTARKDFTPTEAVAIGRLIEAEHRVKLAAQKSAMSRQCVAKRSDRSTTAGKEDVVTPLGKTDAVASRAVGMDPSTYRRAKRVVAAAEVDPEKFGDLAARMDETGNVSGTHREMERRKSGGKVGRHPIHAKRHTPTTARIVQATLTTLEGVCVGLNEIEEIDCGKAQAIAWADALDALLARMRRFSRRLRKCK
jgi:ParB family chromosome partitioning protein